LYHRPPLSPSGRPSRPPSPIIDSLRPSHPPLPVSGSSTQFDPLTTSFLTPFPPLFPASPIRNNSLGWHSRRETCLERGDRLMNRVTSPPPRRPTAPGQGYSPQRRVLRRDQEIGGSMCGLPRIGPCAPPC
jgi:hypothetical protein